MRSSLGFHTMTLFINLDKRDVFRLIKDFKKYSKKTGSIKIYHTEICDGVEYDIVNGKLEEVPVKRYNLKVSYYMENHGIEWLIRYCNWSNDFKSYMVEVTINPKILGGVNDYITAATYDDMKAAIINFNAESKKISRLLGYFEMYKLKRIDYCINLYLPELACECNTEQIMTLIRRSNIPTYFKEWTKYDEISHRKKSKPSSFYLMNHSVNINCYSKYMELQERSFNREQIGLSPVSQTTLDAARGIIRFEVQCKYRKTYGLSRKAFESGNGSINKYESLLTHISCLNIVSYYFKKIIGAGDWYSLNEAIKIIKSYGFHVQKQNRLINAIHIVNQCRSIPKAKEQFTGDELIGFINTLHDLTKIGISPVTIPKDWGIKHITNPFSMYCIIVDNDVFKQDVNKFNRNHLYESIEWDQTGELLTFKRIKPDSLF